MAGGIAKDDALSAAGHLTEPIACLSVEMVLYLRRSANLSNSIAHLRRIAVGRTLTRPAVQRKGTAPSLVAQPDLRDDAHQLRLGLLTRRAGLRRHRHSRGLEWRQGARRAGNSAVDCGVRGRSDRSWRRDCDRRCRCGHVERAKVRTDQTRNAEHRRALPSCAFRRPAPVGLCRTTRHRD